MEIIGNMFFWANRPCPIFWVWCFRGPLFQGWRWYINLWIKQMLLNNRNKSILQSSFVYEIRNYSKKWQWDDMMLNIPQTKTLSIKTSSTTSNLVWHVTMLQNIENIKWTLLFPFGLEMNMTKILIILVKENDE